MSNTEKIAKRRETRIKQRCKEREDLFTSDYIRYKYPAIHDEAVRVYELLNKHYPNKVDVRKTPEHKAWKINGTANLHPAFNIRQAVVIPPNAQLTVIFPEQPPNPEPAATPEPPNTEPTARPEQPPNPEPAATPEPPNTEPTARPEQPPNPEPAATPEPPSPEPPNPEPSSPKPPTPPKPKGKIPYTDNMQLIIPLLKSPVKHPGLITETLEIVTEEILQGDEQPTSIEQIDPQIMEQLITELRADPDLGAIFADIEQQVELEGLDIDIELDMDTRLEDELNWEFW